MVWLAYKSKNLALALSTLIMSVHAFASDQNILFPELVEVAPGSHIHRASGEFLKDGLPIGAPQIEIRFTRPLHIMKYQITNNAYARCVAENACGLPFKQLEVNSNEKPVTGVSFTDTQNYANWLTKKTGVVWRLPTDPEWAFSAASRYFDDGTDEVWDQSDPSKRTRLKYNQTARVAQSIDTIVKIKGAYGANENGIFDQSGNVWEWTSTCYQRSNFIATEKENKFSTENCGVRVIEGRHRTYMTFFVQDAKSGGCSVGAPPSYLGFRLVRDNPRFFSFRWLSNWWTTLGKG